MGDFLYRKDNKKLLVWAYIAFVALIIGILIINVLNTKQVSNMYLMLYISLSFIAVYFFIHLFLIKRNKSPLKLEDNYLAFYVSFNKHNKKLKLLSMVVDVLQLLMLTVASIYYLFVMKFNEVYVTYPLILISVIMIANISIIIKDILKLKSFDRIDAKNNSYQFSIIDKKILFMLNLLIICFANIGILSYTKPHFAVYFNDLLTFEIISSILLTISLSSIFISKIYYYHFDIKQIEQKEFNTRYLEPIGEGRYAKVFKAYVSSLDNVYAVKKLSSNDPTIIDRFKSEFNLMKSLDHPNLLHVYSLDEIKYEYNMDYCDYELCDYIDNHELSNETKTKLTIEVLEAFEYLHKRGILHRDVSPSNIMIKENTETHEPLIKVTDFGIAKDTKIKKMTRTHTRVLGTLFDPAIEDFDKYNVQNDIYGLGIIINYINKGNDSVVLDDSKLSNIVSKCMDCNLAKRYHHVSEIIAEYKEVSL